MTHHHYMYPRVTELREGRPAPPTVRTVRQPGWRGGQRALVESSLLRLPDAR